MTSSASKRFQDSLVAAPLSGGALTFARERNITWHARSRSVIVASRRRRRDAHAAVSSLTRLGIGNALVSLKTVEIGVVSA